MKLVSYLADGTSSYGIWQDDGVVDLKQRIGGAGESIRSILDRLDEAKAHEGAAPDYSHDAVKLLVPVPDPGKILCVGLNYKTHIAETGRDAPTHPILFPRYPSSLVASGEDLVRPKVSTDFDYEGELAFVIGRGGRHIAAADALAHVAGFACLNDGSIRDWQRHTSQFLPGKTFWHSGSFGPWLVTPDETGDLASLTLTTRLNGEVMQQATLDDLLFGVPELIAYISTILPLESGDVVATGTTGGVGLFRKPPVWMTPGDKIEIEIERIGTLVNGITDEQ
ncbi:5-carboxymethyl-2-hydroxymuconate isomerase [Sphingobium sp. SCG-1]|uniref:fumarylacetoacetate hydrolase family protein n=1 Tax=Sphingobium sp. SCG-1 TaxID=2072936 RepID=UPI000CD6BBAF|nr:fumarylacetoacetate hydrolase family protein [Sphingobium sp. SCG-1]AUW59286.1 5-carboxymethyl-2-hydroxymuconate isomerase [Sphingobium sp. SCG-1]